MTTRSTPCRHFRSTQSTPCDHSENPTAVCQNRCTACRPCDERCGAATISGHAGVAEPHGRALLQQPGPPAVMPHVAADPKYASPPCHAQNRPEMLRESLTGIAATSAQDSACNRSHTEPSFSLQHAGGHATCHRQRATFAVQRTTTFGRQHTADNMRRAPMQRPAGIMQLATRCMLAYRSGVPS